ncbi:hypothetical protein [Halomonas sp. KRD171]|uniref:hypothetical protein n=1 Tax=Halomonas sp. KRD171 TaxID=2729726 RepID=UPI0019D1049A|nr:hypothetical protein [Halomonas sp. KRD171]
MFMTHNQDEQLLGRPFSREQFWSRVELSRDDLWYYVCTTHKRIGGTGRRYYLFTEVADLVALIEDNSDFFWIQRVMVVTPPQINGTGCWSMYELKELVSVADSLNPNSIEYVYLLEEGLIYATGDKSIISDHKWHQVLFSEEHHAFPDDIDQ